MAENVSSWERKAEMDARADAFVALPGGFGTLEELLEVLTLRQLRLHDRPIVLVNGAGYWDPFLAMVADMVAKGFAPLGEGALFQVARTAAEAVDLAESGPSPIAGPFDGRGAPVPEAALEDWTAVPGDPPPPPRRRGHGRALTRRTRLDRLKGCVRSAGTAAGATRGPGRARPRPPT
ncbi:MAG TPA: TIGR00730 family Rossman fold protein [Actinomycetes bacterium]|nr:TIGR00730 family Rossman fold protein [Actinomycetes bacterium]